MFDFANSSLLIILIGLAVVGGGLIIGALVLVLGRADVSERLNTFVEAPRQTRRTSQRRDMQRLNRFRYQLNMALGMLDSEELQTKLNSANWQITPSEYFLIRFFGAIVSFILGSLILGSWIAGAALGPVAYSIPSVMLFTAVNKRQKQFQDQLIDTLTLIKGAVAAGSSFLQALDVVSGEMAAPSSEEFRRVRREVELGLPLSQALSNLANRMESDDLFLVVNAVNINMQIGGNLTLILDTVTETIRNRIYLFGEIRSLTSYARYTSYLLTLLPFLTAFALAIISPTYFEQLMQPGVTRYILIYAFISVVVGNIILRRVSKIDV